ncbi:hypothetical protein PV10_03735 [Exophiala mesophila]|uniref:CMP/dCMP-type deaminase domain-containing protein n=1 Tax=Exophiala mesophila TaxID=212818 RepID=A0A0D1XW47_EXOME|nr:uncharacterized protein PV10_03735 [Exophiala mesophila]KIV92436.1 hypothetical protein PV10_03735 [Exophiala mesophila]
MSNNSPHHLHYLRHALSLAQQSPPKPTNFRVGCVIVSYPASDGDSSPLTTSQTVPGTVLETGYTLELEGNTHAEQNALSKLQASQGSANVQDWSLVLPQSSNVTLYTTLEPCGLRLSGNLPCVDRIIATRRGLHGEQDSGAGIRKVIFGAREPGTFVADSKSLQKLDQAGVSWEFVPGLEEDILKVAMEGHVTQASAQGHGQDQTEKPENATTGAKNQGQMETNVDDISEEERKRQAALPRNPKKRMMEVDVPP